MRSRALIVVVMGGLVLAACGNDSGGEAAADCPDGARVIEIQALDTLRFDPDSVSVQSGEQVCFVITNEGETDHEFVVGDQEMQDEHAMEMAEGDMEMGDEEMGGMPEVEIAPGEAATVTTTFDAPGELLFACHEPGHYEGGMVGTLTIT